MGRTEEKDLKRQFSQYENDGERLRLLLQKTSLFSNPRLTIQVEIVLLLMITASGSNRRRAGEELIVCYKLFMCMTLTWKTN